MNNYYYTWENFNQDVKIICGKIMQSDFVPSKIIGIKRGGVCLATSISYLTNIPVDYYSPNQQFEENILIVDDICDSGETFFNVTKNIKKFKTASLYFNIKQNFNVDYFARKIDRDYEKFWVVFPWEMNT